MTFRSLSLVFVVVFLALGTVGFGESQRRTEFFSFTFGPIEEVLSACPGGFNAVNRVSGVVRVLARVDNDGIPVQDLYHYAFFDSVYYNDEDPTWFLEGSEKPQLDRVVFEDGKAYISGQGFKLRVPGEGVIFQTVGRWTYDFATGEYADWRGPDDYFTGDYGKLCRALSPH